MWTIPASGRGGGLLFFGVVWCAFIGIFTAAVAGQGLKYEGGGDAPGWFVVPFLGLFWAVGLGMLYAGVRNKYAQHRLILTGDTLTLRRDLFGHSKLKAIPRAEVLSVAQAEFYRQNYQPVFGIQISSEKAKLRFGSVLRDEEKEWLVEDVRFELFGPPAPPPEPVRQTEFSLEIPQSKGGAMVTAAIGLLIGLGFLFYHFSRPVLLRGRREAPADFLESLWRTLTPGGFTWQLVVGGIVLVLSAWWMGHLVRTRLDRKRVEVTDDNVSLRTYRDGALFREKVFPRASVERLRSKENGSSNGTPRKDLDLMVDGTAHKVAFWIDGAVADKLAEDFRRAF